MYEAYFRLAENPFGVNPDPRFLYMSEVHQEALAHLIYGVRQRKGFIVITGDVGTGKTTLLNKLLQGLDEHTRPVFISNPRLSTEEFLKTIAHGLGLQVEPFSKAEFLIRMEALLVECMRRGENVVLVVDEAQNLSAELLEEIRLLSNLETAAEKMLQIILVGQQELNDKLAGPQLRQLRQRISQKFHISPLNRQETAEYIEHRLQVAGYAGASQLFSGRAVSRLYDFSGGYPRLINVVCDNLLLAAYARETHRVGASLVKEVTQNMEAAYEPVQPAQAGRSLQVAQVARERAALYGLVALAVILFLLAYYRTGVPGW